LNPIIATLRVKHEGISFDGRGENPMNVKTTFEKVKDMSELSYSSRERVVENEGGIPLPPKPSCGRLKKGINEKRLKTQPTPYLKIIINIINHGNKENKSKKFSTNNTSLIFHYSKKRGHNIVNCWYSKA
jgi:hypothetical protein